MIVMSLPFREPADAIVAVGSVVGDTDVVIAVRLSVEKDSHRFDTCLKRYRFNTDLKRPQSALSLPSPCHPSSVARGLAKVSAGPALRRSPRDRGRRAWTLTGHAKLSPAISSNYHHLSRDGYDRPFVQNRPSSLQAHKGFPHQLQLHYIP